MTFHEHSQDVERLRREWNWLPGAHKGAFAGVQLKRSEFVAAGASPHF